MRCWPSWSTVRLSMDHGYPARIIVPALPGVHDNQMGCCYFVSRTMMAFFWRLYGAHPVHLVVLVAALALTAHTISVLGVDALFNPTVWWQSIVVWFAVAIIAYDLILFPLYALGDRLLPAARRTTADQCGDPEPGWGRVPVTN